ncbi:hypothetical protein Q31b_43140 [Novipirellula aureliae]|uniref:Uncharacterized protein n=2 Tax=Novipirellula aureliae TaxID=2527966 RepID=A0A5C6DR97_9BACT|nr:hypothetical protein Q31b_43140 [Novipirellula aureliae]
MEEFPQAQFLFTSEMEVEERRDGSVPEVKNHQTKLDLVRMRSENNKHVLQLGDDRMAFNLLEGGKDYPGFANLLDETLRHLETYRSIYEPSGTEPVAFWFSII